MTEIRSYEQANEYLGKKNSRPIRYKTRVNRRGENIAITHHETDIVTYCDLGINKNFENECMVIIDTQGWHTSTTKERLNCHLPRGYHVWQEDSIWYISYPMKDPPTWANVATVNRVFADGMRILPDGTVEGAGPPAAELKKLNKEILKYSRDYIKALFAGEVGKPGPGDCFYCMFVPEIFTVSASIDKENVISLTPQNTNPANHLTSHFEESYYVPSLLVRAIEMFPVSKAAGWALGDFWGHGKVKETPIWFYDVAKQQLRSSLKRYLRRQLGLAS